MCLRHIACVCVDGTFYLVTSTFLYFPGIAVYASTDLAHWTHIGMNLVVLSMIGYCLIEPDSKVMWSVGRHKLTTQPVGYVKEHSLQVVYGHPPYAIMMVIST